MTKVAVVQKQSASLEKGKTIRSAVTLVEEAARNGAGSTHFYSKTP